MHQAPSTLQSPVVSRLAGRSCLRTACAQASMSALISASAIPARLDMILAPYELPIHTPRTNQALPLRHGISDFFESTVSGLSGPMRLLRSKQAQRAECPVPTTGSLKRPGPLSTPGRRRSRRDYVRFRERRHWIATAAMGADCVILRSLSQRLLRVILYRGDPAASPAMSAVTSIVGQIPHRSETMLSAMCGRRPVGKGFLHVCSWVGAAMCSASLRGSHDRWP